MRKLLYLFVMVAGMSLAAADANAQDPKAPVRKEATAACSKSGETASAAKCDKKETAAACANKDASATSQNVNNKATGACCKSKAVATASDAKDSKSVN